MGIRTTLTAVLAAAITAVAGVVLVCLRLAAGPWVSAAIGLGTAAACLLGLQTLLSIRLDRPLRRLEAAASGLEGGTSGPGLPIVGSLEALADRLEAIRTQRAQVSAKTRRVTTELEQVLRRTEGHLAQVREALGEERDSFDSIVRSAEELGTALEQFRASLDAIAGSTSDNSSSLIEMTNSIDEVASTADQLSQHVSSTASAVIQMVQSVLAVGDSVEVLSRETDATASAMVGIDASTRQIAGNAREATELSGRMADSAAEGSNAVQETLHGIHESYAVIRETALAMEELNDASRAIGSVVKIINEINDKTKLLALNAAIIAAQAGEHGKSFSVVSHEIKSLSDRTASSTGEISRIIQNTRERMDAARAGVARGEQSMGRSVELAERAGSILGRILSTAQVSHEMAGSILRATQEQAQGSRRVIVSMEEVSSMVAYIRKAAQEHRVSGESVSRRTDVMRDLTEQVKLATGEQANVSRYISDAIARIDRSLKEFLQAVVRERQETDNIVSQMGALQQLQSVREQEFHDLGESVACLRSQLAGLEGDG